MVTAVGRQLGYAFYLILDALQWMQGAKAVRFEKETAQKISKNAARFWLIGLTFSLISGVYKSHQLAQRLKFAQRPRATAEKEAERRVELHQLAGRVRHCEPRYEHRLVQLQRGRDWCGGYPQLAPRRALAMDQGERRREEVDVIVLTPQCLWKAYGADAPGPWTVPGVDYAPYHHVRA